MTSLCAGDDERADGNAARQCRALEQLNSDLVYMPLLSVHFREEA